VRARVLPAPGDEERRDALALGELEELERRVDRLADLVLRLGLRARAEREVVGDDRRVVRQRRLVDVDDDREAAVAVTAVVATALARDADDLHAAAVAAPLEPERAIPAGAVQPALRDVVDLGDLLLIHAGVVVRAQGVLAALRSPAQVTAPLSSWPRVAAMAARCGTQHLEYLVAEGSNVEHRPCNPAPSPQEGKMHQELLMHVAAADIEDRLDFAADRRKANEARRGVESRAVKQRRRLRWYLRRSPAQPVA